MRDPSSGWVQLSSAEFFLLWTALGLGDPPTALEIAHIGRTGEARAEMAEQASAALADRELGTVHEPARDVAAMLRTLAAGRDPGAVSLDMRVVGPGSPLLGYAAAGERGAAVAARVDGEVRLGQVRATALAGSLLGSLPSAPAGPGRPANVTAGDYERACAEGDLDGAPGFVRVLHEAGVRPPEASMFAQALTTRTGGGQLGASARDRAGREERAASVVTWLDAEDGRYALRRNGAWVTMTPADLPRLTSMAEEMLEDVG